MSRTDVIEWVADGRAVGLIGLDRVAGPKVTEIADLPTDEQIDIELARMAAERAAGWPLSRLEGLSY